MDFESVRVNRVDFKSFDREAPPQHVSLNIVLIDKTHEGLFPMAYQMVHDNDFSDDYLNSVETVLNSLCHDSFAPLGEVEMINKNDKIVSLLDGNSARYQHLIVISPKHRSAWGGSDRYQEFAAALHTLIHAIRIKQTIASGEFMGHQLAELDLDVSLRQGLSDEQEKSSLPTSMRRVFYTQMLNDSSISYTVSHKATGRRLYELQI